MTSPDGGSTTANTSATTTTTPADDDETTGGYTRAVLRTAPDQAKSSSQFDTSSLHTTLDNVSTQVDADSGQVAGQTKVDDTISGNEKQTADPNQKIFDYRAKPGDAGYASSGMFRARSATAYDDKNAVLAKVGNVDDYEASRADALVKGQQQKLAGVGQKLGSNDPGAYKTSDEILAYGEVGLQFFKDFLPAYNKWTGANYSYDDFVREYKFDYGIHFDALVKDSQLLGAAAASTTEVTANLDKAAKSLFPTWEGTAATQFSTAMKAFAAGDKTVTDTLSEAGQGILDVTLAMEKIVYTKAVTVSGMYTPTLVPGIYGIQALTGLINVARNVDPDDDASKRWVLGTFKLKMDGRHDNDTDQDMWDARDALDNPSREHAISVATQWLNEVLKPQFDVRVRMFNDINTHTKTAIQQLFGTLAGDFQSVSDPYSAMKGGHLADDSSKITIVKTPTPGAGGAGGAGGYGGGGYGGGGAGGGYGGGGAGTGGGTTPTLDIPTPTTPTIPTPTIPTPTLPTPTPTPPIPPIPPIPTPVLPTPPITTPVLPNPVLPTPGDPTPGTGSGDPAPVTHADGSVAFGPRGGLGVSTENPDGSVTVTQTGTDGAQHQYHVVFGPNGQPIVTTADPGTGTAVPLDTSGAVQSQAIRYQPAPDIQTNADGSVSLGADHSLTIGTDHGANGFALTQTVGGQPHAFNVAYDSTGHPHVTDLADTVHHGPIAAPDPIGTVPPVGAHHPAHANGGFHTDSAVHAGPGTSAASFGGGGSGGGDLGGGAGGDASGSGGGHAGGDTTSQIGVGDRFGATAPASGTASPADAAVGSAAAAAGGGSGHGGAMGGMPMGMGGGRPAGGGDGEELKHRYQPKAESVIDEAELEEWDRLGPTIG